MVGIVYCDCGSAVSILKASTKLPKANIVHLLKLSTMINYYPAASAKEMYLMSKLETNTEVSEDSIRNEISLQSNPGIYTWSVLGSVLDEIFRNIWLGTLVDA